MIINDETIKQFEKKYNKFRVKHPNFVATWTKQEEIQLTLPQQRETTEAQLVSVPPITFQTDITQRWAY